MITIVAKNTIRPGMADGFKKTARPLITASQNEAGCISYDLFEDIKNPNILTFIEQWKDEAAIAEHNQTAHFTAIVPQLGQYCEGSSEVHLYKMTEE